MKIFSLRALFVFLITIILTGASVSSADALPVFESFDGSQPSNWVVGGNAEWGFGLDGDSTLLLTPNIFSAGGIGFYDEAFPSTQGIVSEFRYYAGDGDGADGLTFFLVDGDLVDYSNIDTGANGGGLGYTQSPDIFNPHDGIPHAYLGVGFDEYGNFFPGGGMPHTVTIKGSGNGQVGYDYLTHRNIYWDYGNTIDGGWRTVRITVLPHDTSATLRVEMSFDNGQTWKVIINDYEYYETPPANLKLGFTASTGSVRNTHAIGNINVTLPADLQLQIITSADGTYRRGDSFSYAFQVKNTGPNHAGTSTIINTLPLGDSGFTNVTWSYTTSNGDSATGDSTTVNAIPINLPFNATADIVVTGKIGNSVITTDDLQIELNATPAVGVNDPSPSSAQLTVDIAVDVPTPAEDVALANIESYARTHGGTTAPTVETYNTARVIGVTQDILNKLNAAIASIGPGAAQTREKLQQIIIDVLSAHINPAPTMAGGSGPQQSLCHDPVAKNYNVLGELCIYDKVEKATSTATTTATSTRDLKLGMKGYDVGELQKILVNTVKTPVVATLQKTGPTGYFGPQTKKALTEYQKQSKITATGYFGPLTKNKMKADAVVGVWW